MVTIGVLISAHTPRYENGMLWHCLQSVLAQTRPPDAIAVAIDHEGIGAAKCKQRALEMLDTEYVSVIDSDDWMLEEHLFEIDKAINETGADLVYPWFQTFPPGGDPFPESFFTDPWDPANPRHTTTTITARRGMMLKVGYSAKEEGAFEDDDWNMTLGLVNLGAIVYHIPKRTWIYSHHSENTSGRASNWKR